LFKDLSSLVVEQGTVLDRIDYNILEASHHIEKGNKHLDGALKIE
jgi:syntaxin 16